MTSGPFAGISGLAFRDDKHGIAVGGDFTTPATSPNALALTSDGGKTWHLAADPPNQYRTGVVYVKHHDAIIVGLTGSEVSSDGGETWTHFDDGSFDAIDCAGGDKCWASGGSGRVAYLQN
jgi:photosystem II stability/assembly factor-like uncharacterized protein